MRSFNVEEKYVIDQEINNLSSEQKLAFFTEYKDVKNENTFMMLAIFLGLLGGPFFYIGFSNVRTSDILVLIFGTIGLIFSSIFFIFLFYLGIIIWGMLVILYYNFLYVTRGSHYKKVIDDYNYNHKVEVLRTIIA